MVEYLRYFIFCFVGLNIYLQKRTIPPM